MTGPDELRQEIAALGGRAGALTAPSAPCATARSLAARPCGPALVPLPGRIRSVGENHLIVGNRREPMAQPRFRPIFLSRQPRNNLLTTRCDSKRFFGTTHDMSLIGCAGVSTTSSSRPKSAGCESVFEDHASGAAHRPPTGPT